MYTYMNWRNRSSYGGAGVGSGLGAGAGLGPRVEEGLGSGVGLVAGHLMAGVSWRAEGILTLEWSGVGMKQRAKTKEKELLCLLNGLAELLGESF